MCVCVCFTVLNADMQLGFPQIYQRGNPEEQQHNRSTKQLCVYMCVCVYVGVCVCVYRASQVRDRRSLQGGQQASCPQQAVLHHSQALQQLLPAHRLQVRNSPPPPSSAQVS